MKTYVALLRGVMPTGKNRVPMAQLRSILSDAGFENVRTYIQSGNALVDTKLSAKEVEMKVHELIKQHMGAHISVVVRTGKQLQKVLDANPFRDGFDPSRVFYVLFKNKPSPIKVEEFCAQDFGKEKLAIEKDAAYLYMPENAARSKLSNNLLERKLEITVTTRNLNTMKKLVELSNQLKSNQNLKPMNPIIYPCLWFNGTAKEAAEFYCSAFNNSKIISENHLVVNIESAQQKFMLLNGGPQFKLNPSISFYVVCDNEKELDTAWNQFLHGGKILMPLGSYAWSKKYGWVQDQYGQSWQLALGKIEEVGQKFTPSLLFTGTQCGKAAESIECYTSVFKNSKIRGILRFEKEEPEPEGLVKHAQFNLGKHVFMAMDSSLDHGFGFNEALSFVVECDTKDEIDYFWNRLSAVPEAEQCGWLKDKFGISWQIIPTVLEQLMNNPLKAPKVVEAFMQMKKFDIEKILQAAG